MLACPVPAGYDSGIFASTAAEGPAVIEAADNTVRVLQITDPHLFANSAGALRGTVTDESLREVLAHVERGGWPADFVAMTGDLIQDDSREAYRRFRSHFSPLGLPVLCIPGNHDVRELMQDELAGEPFRYCAAIARRSWLVVGIDSCRTNSAGGHVTQQEFERLEGAVAASDARHVLVCLHHPPLPVGSAWLDQVGLDNGEEFLERVAAIGRVRGCLFGHVHQNVDTEVRGMRILGTPSTCRQFRPDSDEFALDERSPAYRRVSLGDDGSIADELIWVEQATTAD